MYVVEKDGKYLKTREGGWVDSPGKGIGTSSKEVADEWAKKHGGKTIDLDREDPPKYFYTLALIDKATGEVDGWFMSSSDGSVCWIHEPFKDNETPSKLTLERVSEIMAQNDIEDHSLWIVTDSQDRKMILPNQYKKEDEPMTQTTDQTADQRKTQRKFRIRDGKKKQTDTDKPQQPKGEEKEGWSPLLFVYAFLLVSLLLLALFWNVQPFVTFIKLIAARVDFAEISRFLFSLPFIGGVFKFIAEFYAAVLGSLLYLIFQGLEIAPFLYKRNPARTQRILTAVAQWQTYRVTSNDSGAVKDIKRAHNRHPVRTYQTLSATRNFIYAMEAAICFMASPPVPNGNPFTFLWYLITFQLGKIDWINVLLLLSVMFLVDVLVRITLAIYPEIFPKKGSEYHA